MQTSGNGDCPFFLREMQACGLQSDGIYLPSRKHLLTYCSTTDFKDCHIYKQLSPPEKSTARESRRETPGRRRFMRISHNRNVTIRSCDPLGIETGEFAEKATALDYSRGGMRVRLKTEIPEETLVLFDFGDDFVIPHLQGIAQLRWRRKINDQNSAFEAGLVFKDHFSQAALSLELEP
ncbi:MAG: PilZ domain-containing protein [Desulfobacteraceae bacterium]|nr:PilZ domain-containing protein [Desulfobacteraceae bacterium]